MQIVIRSGRGVLIVLLTFVAVWAYAGLYGVNVVLRHGGTCWISVRGDSSLLSPSMRLVLASAPTGRSQYPHQRTDEFSSPARLHGRQPAAPATVTEARSEHEQCCQCH